MGILWFAAGIICAFIYILGVITWAGSHYDNPRVKNLNVELAKDLHRYVKEKYHVDVSSM